MSEYTTEIVRIISTTRLLYSRVRMPPAIPPKAQSVQQDPDTLTRVGGWLFRRRTSLPAAHRRWRCCSFRPPRSSAALSTPLMLAGVPIVGRRRAAAAVGVHHIGVISRTRSDRLGPLVDTGPFALVRNPLYLGNIALWVGFAVSARLALARADRRRPARARISRDRPVGRTAPRVAAGRAVSRLRGARAALDPRFAGASRAIAGRPGIAATFSWTETLFSERGTLIAIAVGLPAALD